MNGSHRPILRVVMCTAVLALSIHAPLRGQDSASALAALLAEAEARNPDIEAAKATAAAALARVPQAGALADPMLGIGVMNFPAADPSFSREMMTMTTVQLGAQLPLFGKRGLRDEIARHQAEAAQWEVERVRQSVQTAVKTAYYQIHFVDRARQVTARNGALVTDFASLTATRYSVGTGAQPDVLKAQVERTRLDEQLIALREERASAVARLNALLGRDTATPVPEAVIPEPVRLAALAERAGDLAFTSVTLANLTSRAAGAGPAPGIPPIAELQRLALENNPAVQAHVRRVAAQQSVLALAQKAKLPDFNFTIAYSRRPDFGDFVNFMVSAPVPIFAGRKQDQGVAEQAAALTQHQAMHRVMVDRINAEIAALAARLERTRDQLVLLNDGILPQARTALASSTASYQVGRVDFLTLLDAQVTLYRHDLDYHRLLTDFATDLAELEQTVGLEILK